MINLWSLVELKASHLEANNRTLKVAKKKEKKKGVNERRKSKQTREDKKRK